MREFIGVCLSLTYFIFHKIDKRKNVRKDMEERKWKMNGSKLGVNYKEINQNTHKKKNIKDIWQYNSEK